MCAVTGSDIHGIVSSHQVAAAASSQQDADRSC